MKKLLIFTLLVFPISISSYAQNKEFNKFGIRAGWHSALMYRDGAGMATTQPLNTFYIGVFKEFKLVPKLYAGGGLEYFQNGFKSELIDLKRKLYYISVPLYLKVKLGAFYATAGTALNFKVAEVNIISDIIIDPLEEFTSSVFDLPLEVGIGVQISRFSIETKYNWGMIDVNHGASNRYFQLGGAVSF